MSMSVMADIFRIKRNLLLGNKILNLTQQRIGQPSRFCFAVRPLFASESVCPKATEIIKLGSKKNFLIFFR